MEKHITIMGVPMDLGQRYKGVDLGPQAIRYAGVKEGLEKLGCAVTDLGNIEIGRAEQLPDDEANARNLKSISKASQSIAEHTDEIVKSNRFPLIWWRPQYCHWHNCRHQQALQKSRRHLV